MSPQSRPGPSRRTRISRRSPHTSSASQLPASASSPARPCSARISRYMLCGESRGCLRKEAPAPSVSLPEDSASEAWASRCSGKPFNPTPVSGCSRHMPTAAAHMVYRSVTDWSGASATCVMLVIRSWSIAVPTPNPPTRITPAAATAAPTFNARRVPASTSWTVHVTAVAIQAPRLKDSASGSRRASAHPAATTRCRTAVRPSASPVAHTSPKDTTVAMPITSCDPKVPTARIISPWYEAPVPVAYWCTPIAPCHRPSPTNDQASSRKSPRPRTRSSTVAGTRTKTWR